MKMSKKQQVHLVKSSELDLSYQIEAEAEKITPLLEEVFAQLKTALPVEYFAELEFDLEIAAREMLANAIEHGCSLAAAQNKVLEEYPVKIKLKLNAEELLFEVKDPGPGFEWENYDLKTMPEFSEKGRGLKMINNVADKIKFNQAGNLIKAYFKIR